MYCIYPNRSLGIYFLYMIFDPAFKRVHCLFKPRHLFPTVQMSRVEWQVPVTLFMSSIAWLEANSFIKLMDSTHGQNQVNESCGKTTNVTNTLKWSTVAISERRIHISSKILTYGTILTSINYDKLAQVFISFIQLHYSCIFEPLCVYEPGCNMVKCGNMVSNLWFQTSCLL